MSNPDKFMEIRLPEPQFSFLPVTIENWVDLEGLFSENGIQNGCWCMYWRIPRKECQRNYGAGNRLLLRKIVEAGNVPGILAYDGGISIGWCAVAPREDFPVLGRSPTLKPIDDLRVWSIVCFFISKPYRQSGMTHLLIQAAIQFARERGAKIIEAYPINNDAQHIDYERYSGLASTFLQEGFVEVARRSERKPIMRYVLG